MPSWKKVRIDFPTVKLGAYIEPLKTTFQDRNDPDYQTVYGVTNIDGITFTGKESSKDVSNYITLEENCFVYNPYRVNVGSIGLNDKNLKGCVSPAYVVFRVKETLNPLFLYRYLKSEFGNHVINWYGNRGGVRNALRYDNLCEIDIPKVNIETQKEILNSIESVKVHVDELSVELEKQYNYIRLLYQSVLKEGLEGRLTDDWRKQNPVCKGDPDTDAAALLEMIKQEKQRLIAEGKIKREKPLEPINAEEVPFKLPEGWVWCRLGEICDFITKGTTPPTNEIKGHGDIPYLKVYNIVNQAIDFNYKPQFISKEVHNQLNRSKVYPGDVLMNIVGPPLGKVAIVPEQYPEWNINQAIAIFRPLVKKINVFLYKYLACGLEVKKIHTLGVVGQDNISLEQCRNMFFSLPPLIEQQVIVERINVFLEKIDELKGQVMERREHAEELMHAVLREAFEGRAG